MARATVAQCKIKVPTLGSGAESHRWRYNAWSLVPEAPSLAGGAP